MSGRKSGGPPGKRFDWPTIEHDYGFGVVVEGRQQYPSLSKLAKHWGCTPSTASQRSRSGDWVKKRAIHQRECSITEREKNLKINVSNYSETSTQIMQAGTDMLIELRDHGETPLNLRCEILKKLQAILRREFGMHGKKDLLDVKETHQTIETRVIAIENLGAAFDAIDAEREVKGMSKISRVIEVEADK